MRRAYRPEPAGTSDVLTVLTTAVVPNDPPIPSIFDSRAAATAPKEVRPGDFGSTLHRGLSRSDPGATVDGVVLL